jgi:hypothetical protein
MKKILVIIALILFISTVSAQNKSNNKKGGAGKGVNASDTKKDDIQGAATWIVEAFNNGENKPGDVSRLRATKNFKIFRGENEIGTWRKIDETKVIVNIQNTDLKIGGTMELLMKEKNPPTFSGKIKKADGSEYKVNLIMRKD